MAHHLIFILSSLLMALVAFQGTQAVQYEIDNDVGGTLGGTRFNNEIGVDGKQIRRNNIYRKDAPTLKMSVDSYEGIAYTSNNEIHVSSSYIAGYSGDVKAGITGVLYHEVTHIWQSNGNGQAPGGLIEGIAGYVRLKANYIPSHCQTWRWCQVGTVVRCPVLGILQQSHCLKDGFVAELNGKMRTGYNDNFFVELLGKPVYQLWSDYKTAFGVKS